MQPSEQRARAGEGDARRVAGRHEVDRCTESARDKPPVSWELWLSPEGNMGILKNF